MIKRLVFGMLIGAAVGALVAAALVLGPLHIAAFASAVIAYVFAAVTGVLVGLVAGKPIWAKGGQIEAGLKAFFGALLAAGAMFAVRQWLKLDLDLSTFQSGMSGSVGDLPAASLPLIAAVLGGFYELDNTGDEASETRARVSTKSRVSAGASSDADADEEDAGAVPKKMKR